MDGGKDNRMKGKRNKMNQYNRRKAQHAVTTTSSSSATAAKAKAEQQPPRSMIDVADSSDERYQQRRSWGGKIVPPQRHVPNDIIDDDGADLELAENAQMHAGDFDLMSQLPAAVGAHFQFASEKNWDGVDVADAALDNTEASEYFTLNLKLLNVGLQTIPFHKRLDYSSALFTREQLDAMEQAAEAADKNYQNVLREHQTNPRIKINSGSRRSASAKSQEAPKTPQTAVPAERPSEADDELDELLSMTTAQVAKVGLDVGANAENVAPASLVATPVAANGSGGNDDIQQWLDNVLEE